jgi:hypothetical protein
MMSLLRLMVQITYSFVLYLSICVLIVATNMLYSGAFMGGLLMPGEEYSHKFSIMAPTTPGKYLIDLFSSVKAGSGDSVTDHCIDIARYYQCSQSNYQHPMKTGYLSPFATSPISVMPDRPTRVSRTITTFTVRPTEICKSKHY